MLGKLQVVVGQLCFIVYWWWELLPWVAPVTPCKERLEAGKKKQGDSHAPCRMRNAGLQPAGELLISRESRAIGGVASLGFRRKAASGAVGCY